MYGAMRDQVMAGISSDEAGEVIADAVERGRFWAFPASAPLAPLLRQDADELFESLDDSAARIPEVPSGT
jgi:hypothetical protein